MIFPERPIRVASTCALIVALHRAPIQLPAADLVPAETETALEDAPLIEGEDSGSPTVEEDLILRTDEDGLLDRLLRRPPNLQTASYQRLREVPGVTARVAREIIRLRERGALRTFEDLWVIPEMTPERLRRIQQHAHLNGPSRFPPAELLVRTRTRFREPYATFDPLPSTSPFKHREHLHQTVRLETETLQSGFVFLHRTGEPAIIPDSTRDLFLRKWWVLWDEPMLGIRAIAGSYRAEYGYGLVFGQSGIFSAIPVRPKPRGLREDTATMPDVWLHGLGVSFVPGAVECAVFWSRKGYDAALAGDAVNEDLLGLRRNEGAYTTVSALRDHATVAGELVGGSLAVQAGAVRFGCMGYRLRFDLPFSPDKSGTSGYSLDEPDAEYWASVFRGDSLAVGGIHGEWRVGGATVFGEWAMSSGDAGEDGAFTLGVTGAAGPVRPFAVWSGLGDRFHSPYSAPVRVYRDTLNAQRGGMAGAEVRTRAFTGVAAVGAGALSGGLWNGHALSEMPRYPSSYVSCSIDGAWRLGTVEVGVRWWDDTRDRYLSAERYGFAAPEPRLQVTQWRSRRRASVEWRFSRRWTVGVSYEERLTTYSAETDRRFVAVRTAVGARFSADAVRFGVSADAFSADRDVYAVLLEPRWDGVFIAENETNAAGLRARCWMGWRLADRCSFWGGYRIRVLSNRESPVEHTISLQVEFIIGKVRR